MYYRSFGAPLAVSSVAILLFLYVGIDKSSSKFAIKQLDSMKLNLS